MGSSGGIALGCYLIAESFWLNPENWLSIAKAAFGLGFVIFVHELGHFLVAKACGVQCDKFYVGFDVPIKIGPLQLPASLFKKQWGETEYGIGIIPLGGYVKMLGQDDNPAKAAEEAERTRVHKEREAAGNATSADESDFALNPRSYPAKSVPQRMAIISAGVIMNLIFAVIFAAIAYYMGVNYIPCVVGSTLAGDPAWQAGLRPGDKILQLGRDGPRDETLRFTRDLRYKVVETGAGNDLDVFVKRRDGTEKWIAVQPNSPPKQQSGLPTIGVLSASSDQLIKNTLDTVSPASQADVQDDDRVTAVQVGDQEIETTDSYAVSEVLLAHPKDDVVLVVERHPTETESPEDESATASTKSATIDLSARPYRRLGLALTIGPISAIQADSPAQQAGLEVGDQIVAVNGQEVTDPIAAPQLFLDSRDQDTSLTVLRKSDGNEDQTLELNVRPIAPLENGAPRRPNSPVAIDSIGAVFDVYNTIAAVIPGSPAEDAEIQVGDELIELLFVPAEGSEVTAADLLKIGLGQPIAFGPDELNWPWAFRAMQDVPIGVNVKLTYERDGIPKEAVLNYELSDSLFNPDRGLIRDSLNEKRKAQGLSDAFSLGVRETKEGIMQVIMTLRRIHKLFGSLGGPGTIAVVATSEASQGIPRLLVFLTLLSANLAVLNILPIPVLDGGHLMFLAYEFVFGKPVNERAAFALTMLGLSFILCLMVFVIGLDVYRFTGLAG